MPADTPYGNCSSIVVRFNDSDGTTDRRTWMIKITGLLDQIWAIPLGAELMNDIKRTQHTVFVQPALAQSNQCAAANANCYVRLRQAYEGMGSVKFDVELTEAFQRAQRAGISLDGVANRLAGGLSAVTVETARNVAKPSGAPAGYEVRKVDKKGAVVTKKVDGTPVPVWIDAKVTPDSMKALLQGLCDGSRKKMELQMRRGARALSDDLIRCFYIPNATVGDEYLKRGAGCNATISFKPDVSESCWLDEHVTRPPAIGLVHELIHAWRNVNGLRYFKDKEKFADAPTPDDEVMTTGFPPYQWEKYTENMFRGLWAKDTEGAINAPGTPLHGAQPLRHKY
jgi:hypothetical protein